MTKLLFIQTSLRSIESKSLQIAQIYLEALHAETPDMEVDTLDLWKADLPVFDGDKAAAKLNELQFQPTLLTPDPAGDLERAKQEAGRLARIQGRAQTDLSGAV